MTPHQKLIAAKMTVGLTPKQHRKAIGKAAAIAVAIMASRSPTGAAVEFFPSESLAASKVVGPWTEVLPLSLPRDLSVAERIDRVAHELALAWTV